MNDFDKPPITKYEDLLAEREKLETLIVKQKNIIRHDIDELKTEFKKEVSPAMEVVSFIKKVITPETRKQTFITLGTNVAIDIFFTTLFGRTNMLMRLVVPRLLKNYTTHFLYRLNTDKGKVRNSYRSR
jgi:hypothetical protein